MFSMFRKLGYWALLPVGMLLLELTVTILWGWFDHWIIATCCALLFAATTFSIRFLSKNTSNRTDDLWIVKPLFLSWALFWLLNIVAAVFFAVKSWLL